jgi:hypothetical protein
MALQRWNKQANGQFVNGNVLFTFPAIPQGFDAVISVAVPGSPAGIQWQVFISGNLTGSIYGGAPLGPLFLAGGDVVTILSVLNIPGVNNIEAVSVGNAVAVGAIGTQGELPPQAITTGGGIPVGNSILAINLAPSGTYSDTIPTSSNSRGILVFSDTTPVTPAAGQGPYVPVTLSALSIQYGAPDGIGVWYSWTPPGGDVTVVFATTPLAYEVYEVDYDFDFMEVARSLGVYTIQVPNPAPGADWSYTLPAPARLVEVTATLAASAAAATRFPRFYFTNTGLATANTPMTPAGVTASQDYLASGWPGAALVAGAASASLFYGSYPIPDMLLAGGTIKSATNNIQAADQWGGVVLTLSPI